jgi:hypothetical protein
MDLCRVLSTLGECLSDDVIWVSFSKSRETVNQTLKNLVPRAHVPFTTFLEKKMNTPSTAMAFNT